MVDVDKIDEPLKSLKKFDLSNAYERRLAFKIYLDVLTERYCSVAPSILDGKKEL